MCGDTVPFERTPRSVCSFQWTQDISPCFSPPPRRLSDRTPSAPQINPHSEQQTLSAARASRLRRVCHRARSLPQPGRCSTPARPCRAPAALWRFSGLPSRRAPGAGRAARSRGRAVPAPGPARAPAPCTRTPRGPAAGPGCITRREGDRGSFTGLPYGAPDSWPPRSGTDGGPPELIAVFPRARCPPPGRPGPRCGPEAAGRQRRGREEPAVRRPRGTPHFLLGQDGGGRGGSDSGAAAPQPAGSRHLGERRPRGAQERDRAPGARRGHPGSGGVGRAVAGGWVRGAVRGAPSLLLGPTAADAVRGARGAAAPRGAQGSSLGARDAGPGQSGGAGSRSCRPWRWVWGPGEALGLPMGARLCGPVSPSAGAAEAFITRWWGQFSSCKVCPVLWY